MPVSAAELRRFQGFPQKVHSIKDLMTEWCATQSGANRPPAGIPIKPARTGKNKNNCWVSGALMREI